MWGDGEMPTTALAFYILHPHGGRNHPSWGEIKGGWVPQQAPE